MLSLNGTLWIQVINFLIASTIIRKIFLNQLISSFKTDQKAYLETILMAEKLSETQLKKHAEIEQRMADEFAEARSQLPQFTQPLNKKIELIGTADHKNFSGASQQPPLQEVINRLDKVIRHV